MDLPLTPVQTGIAGVLLSIVVWAVYALFKGKIVPRSVLEDLRKDRDDRLADLFRIIQVQNEAAEKRDQALSEIIPMLRELTDNGQTMVALIEALKRTANQSQVGGPG